jgi:hypothetical protein
LLSYTQRNYLVNILNPNIPLKATIVWNDPVNVMWAAKNLLNDLDLSVVSPLGNYSYGNNISSDEFNPVERVVIENPMVGVWAVQVTSKQFAIGLKQNYSIVITSGGEVVEVQTNLIPYSIFPDTYPLDPDESKCLAQRQKGYPANQYIRFQLEDWLAGASWSGVNFDILSNKGKSVYACTFVPNSQTQTHPDNRIYDCAACLAEDTTYTATLYTSQAVNDTGKYIRAVTPQCLGVSLSSRQQTFTMNLKNGECNACPDGSTIVQGLMYSNVRVVYIHFFSIHVSHIISSFYDYKRGGGGGGLSIFFLKK